MRVVCERRAGHCLAAYERLHQQTSSRNPMASIKPSTSRTNRASVIGPAKPVACAGPRCSQPGGASMPNSSTAASPSQQQLILDHQLRYLPVGGRTSALVIAPIGMVRIKRESQRDFVVRFPHETSAPHQGNVNSDAPLSCEWKMPPPHLNLRTATEPAKNSSVWSFSSVAGI